MAFWQKESQKKAIGITAEVARVHPISRVTADKVLVLSPHPDDDVMGCGGLLYSLSESGSKIKVIYFSDGSRGTKNGKINLELIGRREIEARESGKVLGVGEEKFLRLPDKRIVANTELATVIRREIEFDKPDLLLAPGMDELHPDHHAVAEALALAIRNFDQPLNIWLYEVWSASRINRLFIIDDYIDQKRQALKCHVSQMKVKDYDEAILSLNKYRGLFFGVGNYAEAYYATGPRNYRKLFEFYSRHHESKI